MLTAVALAACGSVGAGGNPNVAATVTVDGATTEIPVSEVEEQFDQAKTSPEVAGQLEGDTDGTVAEQIQAQILSRLVLAEIIGQWAEELGITATDEEVAAEREAVVEQSGGQEAFDAQVEQAGFTDEQVDDLLRQRVLQVEIAEEVAGGEVTDAQVEEFYEQNRDARFGYKAAIRHILVEDEDEANRLRDELEVGADFSELAEANSTDTGSAAQGGDLGEYSRGQGLVAEFEEAAFDAEVGELVGPVETEFGFHLIEVTGQTPAQTLEEAAPEIREELQQGQQGQQLEAELRERTQAAEVEVNPRFGTWDPETGEVRSSEPLGDTTESPGEPEPAGTEGAVPAEAPTE